MAKRRAIGPSVSFFAFQDIITAVVGIFILIILILALELAQRVEAAASSEAASVAPVAEVIESLEAEVERMRNEVRQRSDKQSQTAELNAFNRAEKLDRLRAEADAIENRIAQAEAQIQRIRSRHVEAERNDDRLLSEAADLDEQRRLIDQLTKKIANVADRSNRLAGNDSEIYRDRTREGRFIVLVTLNGGDIELRDALTRSSLSMRGGNRLDRFQGWLDTTALKDRQLLVLIEPGGTADFQTIKQLLVESDAVFGFSVVPSGHSVRLNFEVEALP